MSGQTPTTKSTLSLLTLGVLISTPRCYVDSDTAVQHLNYFLDKVVDEPVNFFYEKTDANALSILKKLRHPRTFPLSDKTIEELNPHNTLVIYYHYGFHFKGRTFNEILCKRFLNLYSFDTSLKVIYEQS